MQIQRPRRQELGRLRSYNQFPLQYHTIPEMTADLDRIKAMGFSSTWVNPLFEPSKDLSFLREEIENGMRDSETEKRDVKLYTDPSSLYATRSFAINSKFSAHNDLGDEERKEKDYADIRAYTDRARELGITPMVDLVMRHVAVDNPLVKEKPHWFRRHANGNFVVFGRNEHYHPTTKCWDDVLEFDYTNPHVRREIVDEYLKPMADLLIGRLGFEGFRVDAAGQIPKEVYEEIVPYLDELSDKHHHKPVVMLGETLGQNVNEFLHCGGHMDYVYNSVYFQPFTREFWEHDDTWVSHTKGMLQDAVAPTVGFPGNHDLPRLADFYLNKRHIRGDMLRDVIVAAGMDGEIDIKGVLRIFAGVNDKGVFSPEHLHALVDNAVSHGCATADEALAMHERISHTGKLTQAQVMSWFPTGQCENDLDSNFYRLLVSDMFKIIKEEYQQDVQAARTGGQKQKRTLTETPFAKLIPGTLDSARWNRLMKEAYCFTAFASDGGWFVSRGDEWGVTKASDVFTSTPADMQERAFDKDFSDFIASVNHVLSKLPPPGKPEWVQRCYIGGRGGKTHKNGKTYGNGNGNGLNNSLCSFLIHHGDGFGEQPHLVIANVGAYPQEINHETFMELVAANGRNDTDEKKQFPQAVYLCGDVYLSPHLQTALEGRGVRIERSGETPQAIPDAAQERSWGIH